MIYEKIVLQKGQRVFFFSDPHYGHANICRGTTRWEVSERGGESSVRNFDTVEQMNSAIVDGINKTVGQKDYLVCLGDWSFGGIENIWNFRKRIVCENIIHVLGNHDHHIAYNRHLPNCLLAHDYDTGHHIVSPEDSHSDFDEPVNAQELFKLVTPYLELTVADHSGKRTYCLMHFPITIWNKAHHDRVHLYGHVHGGYTAMNRSMDVGIDNAKRLLGEYRPFSEEEVSKYMKGREYIAMSHHNKNTN